jgi:hypothetical protein
MFTATCQPVINADQFRAKWNEFTDPAIYPDSQITFWIAIATLFLNRCRWGNTYLFGIALYAAHNIVLEAQARETAEGGGIPGMTRGVITGESVGQVSLSYDAIPAVEENGSYWNLTQYGIRFLHIARMMGAGPIQVGPGGSLPGVVPGLYNGPGNAWSGPPVRPGYLST